MKKTVNEAIELAESLLNKCNSDKETDHKAEILHLDSAKATLSDWGNFYGSNYQLDEQSSKYIEDGELYKSGISSMGEESNFKKWTEEFNNAILNCKHKLVSVQNERYRLTKQIEKGRRKGFLWGLFIIAIAVALVAAAFAVYGKCIDKENGGWADVLATIISSIDFVIGVVGFIFERLSDMEERKDRYLLSEIDSAIASNDLEKIQSIAINIKSQISEGDNNIQQMGLCCSVKK